MKKMNLKYNPERPTREQLLGMSASQFKTVLKRKGHKVNRDFFKIGSVSYYKNRVYRFRWWNTIGEISVDVSCPLKDFDRWANSVDEVINFNTWIKK